MSITEEHSTTASADGLALPSPSSQQDDVITAIRPDLTSFWRSCMQAWLTFAEHYFVKHHITNLKSKFLQAIRGIITEVSESISSPLAGLREDMSFDRLKEELLKRHGPAAGVKWTNLIKETTLEAERSSQLLRTLREAGGPSFPSNLLRETLLSCLPPSISPILEISRHTTPLEQIAESHHSTYYPAIAVTRPSPLSHPRAPPSNISSSLQRMKDGIDTLVRRVDHLDDENRKLKPHSWVEVQQTISKLFSI